MSPTDRAEFDPTSVALVGVLFTTVIFGSFAVRSIAGEHSTGMIRTTFAALPNRRRVVAAKAAIVAAIAFQAASPPTSPPSWSGSASSPPPVPRRASVNPASLERSRSVRSR